jgi:alkyl sulfatase BDS1-like metallo-beta-lactamase superfamily hydrolase
MDQEPLLERLWSGAHLYAGWFDGNPAHLKPAPSAELAGEIAALAGGAAILSGRAKALAGAGRTRLAAHLIELASAASPASAEIQAVRAKVYEQCTDA